MNESAVSLADTLLPPDSSIRRCLAIMHAGRIRNVFVVDAEGRLVGVVTAEAVLDAVVRGTDIDSSAASLAGDPALLVTPEDARSRVLDLMRGLRLTEVPVVDDAGRVVGVHTKKSLSGNRRRRNWAVIMAGGRGTRLAPLTNSVPKPMLNVAGRPILEHLVLHLVGAGIRKIFLSVNYLGQLIEDHFGDGSGFGCAIEYLREEKDTPLGTGGPLGLLRDAGYRAHHPLLVLNGDLVTGFAVGDLLDNHASGDAAATIAVTEYQHEIPYGVVEGSDSKLVRMVEKPVSSWQVNSGIYVIEPWLLSRVPRGEVYPITRLFEECLKRGEDVGLWSMTDPWQDVGRPIELARARGDV